MNLVLGLGIFVLGIIVGFVVNKLFFAASTTATKLAEKVSKSEAELAQYKLDVAEHLENSAKLLDQMNQTCQTAMEQMAASTQLLQKATPDNIEHIPFFEKETQEQLAQTVNLRHDRTERSRKEDESISEPPLDYSDAPSGLFEDKKQSVTNSKVDN